MYRVQKKKRSGLFLTVLFLAAFAIGLGIGYGGIKMNMGRQEAEAVPEDPAAVFSAPPEATAAAPNRPASVSMLVEEETEEEAEAAAPAYFVVSQNGSVCVFIIDEQGNQRFSHKLPIETEALREADQKLFEEGIYLDSKQALLELTEDFSS